MPVVMTAGSLPSHPYLRTAQALAGSRFATIRYCERTASTNEDAVALLGDAASAGTTLVAETQDRGTGRKGRSWIAHPGTALLFTTILPEPVATDALWATTLWSALAVRSALHDHGVNVDLQWPNDLLLHGKKLCGILCVSRIVNRLAWVGCGIGINVTRTPGAADGIEPPPSFCSDAAPVERDALLASILHSFDANGALLKTPRAIAQRWEREAGLPGKRYRILRDGDERAFDAIALALTGDGSLLVETHEGDRHTIALADARILR